MSRWEALDSVFDKDKARENLDKLKNIIEIMLIMGFCHYAYTKSGNEVFLIVLGFLIIYYFFSEIAPTIDLVVKGPNRLSAIFELVSMSVSGWMIYTVVIDITTLQ